LEGDPLGSLEEGTLKVLAEPRLITLENQSFSFRSGGEVAIRDDSRSVVSVPFGRMIEGKSSTVKRGTIRLDLTLSNTTVGKRTKERIELNTESTRTITTVKLGEVVKLRWGKEAADKQIWAELSVEEITP
jgi:Flp pilus assembly secretin CpaC